MHIVDRDMECRRQGTDDLDETRLAVAVHDNPVFMKGNGKRQASAASLSTATRRPDRIKETNSLGSAIFRTIADDIDFAIQNIHDL